MHGWGSQRTTTNKRIPKQGTGSPSSGWGNEGMGQQGSVATELCGCPSMGLGLLDAQVNGAREKSIWEHNTLGDSLVIAGTLFGSPKPGTCRAKRGSNNKMLEIRPRMLCATNEYRIYTE